MSLESQFWLKVIKSGPWNSSSSISTSQTPSCCVVTVYSTFTLRVLILVPFVGGVSGRAVTGQPAGRVPVAPRRGRADHRQRNIRDSRIHSFGEWNGSTPVSTDAVLLAGFLESARNGWEPPDGLPSPGPSDTEVSIDYADWVSS